MLSSGLKLLPAFKFSTYGQGLKFMGAVKELGDKIDFKSGDFSALEQVSNLSIHDWCVANGMEQLDHDMLDPMVAMMVCANSKVVSMGHLVLLISLMQGVCGIRGGMGTISEALFGQVKDTVVLNCEVSEVAIDNGKVQGVIANGELIDCDDVIVALDAQTTLKLVPGMSAAQRKALQTCGYSQIFNFFFITDKPIPGLSGATYMVSTDENVHISDVCDAYNDPNGCMYCIQSRYEYFDELDAMDEESRIRLVMSEARRYFPELPERPKIVRTNRWQRAVNLEGPGQFFAIEDLKKNHMYDVEGLHLAGDYMFLIASTEGSMDAGKHAAERLLAKSR